MKKESPLSHWKPTNPPPKPWPVECLTDELRAAGYFQHIPPPLPEPLTERWECIQQQHKKAGLLELSNRARSFIGNVLMRSQARLLSWDGEHCQGRVMLSVFWGAGYRSPFAYSLSPKRCFMKMPEEGVRGDDCSLHLEAVERLLKPFETRWAGRHSPTIRSARIEAAAIESLNHGLIPHDHFEWRYGAWARFRKYSLTEAGESPQWEQQLIELESEGGFIPELLASIEMTERCIAGLLMHLRLDESSTASAYFLKQERSASYWHYRGESPASFLQAQIRRHRIPRYWHLFEKNDNRILVPAPHKFVRNYGAFMQLVEEIDQGRIEPDGVAVSGWPPIPGTHCCGLGEHCPMTTAVVA